MPLHKRERGGSCPCHMDLCEAVAEITEAIHTQELSKDQVGKEVLALEKMLNEKDRLLALCDNREDVNSHEVLNFD